MSKIKAKITRTISFCSSIFLLFSFVGVEVSFAKTQSTNNNKVTRNNDLKRSSLSSNYLNLNEIRGGYVSSNTAASLLAGSFAGAVGVGVSFPLDTLKTKSQVMDNKEDVSMLSLIKYIWKTEGVGGFFGGVRTMMAGQALIKALAFSANTYMLAKLSNSNSAFCRQLSNMTLLILAAAFSGFVTSFLVAPVERIKVMMQANSSYRNELECIREILKTEGISGLMSRGLNATILREVPSYCIYFVIYGLLIQTRSLKALGPLAPCIGGAISGMTSWLPVYPVDAVKTIVQNTKGEEKVSSILVARQLYDEGGIGAFFDGITPKMLRAAVNHAVTFSLYEKAMQQFRK